MTRYDELVSLYLDGEPSEAELNELETLLRGDDALATDFRDQLMLWEAWSQETAPERSGDAFLSALHTHLRAEQDSSEFELSVTKQLRARKNPFLLQPIIAIAAVLVILLSIGVFMNPADLDTGLVSSAEASNVHLHGECLCPRCVLGTKGPCSKALRYVDEQGETQVIRLAASAELKKCRGLCRGARPVIIEGEFVEENGEKALFAVLIEFEDEKAL